MNRSALAAAVIAGIADAQDRHLFLVGAAPKDPDEGLSDGDDDEGSVATMMKKSKSGESDEDGNLSDVDDELLEGLDDQPRKGSADDDDEGNESARARKDMDEEEETYKQRFAATKADRDEKARLLRQQMEENARLRAVATIDADVNEEELARSIQDAIYADISKIDEKDPAKRTKAAYDVVGRHIALSTKKAVELALRQVNTSREQEVQQTTEASQKRERAANMAKLVMKEEGIDPEKHFGMFQEEVDKQMEQDPDWFQAIPAEQHFVRLVNRVKERIKTNRQANDEHRREAGGQINNGSRVRSQQPREADDDDGEKDTLKGAMLLSRKANLIRGRRAFGLTRR